MPQDRSFGLRDIEARREPEQSRSLLAQGAIDDEEEEGPTPAHQRPPFPQSSLSRNASKGFLRAPRTINRVRFDVADTDSGDHALNGHSREGSDWWDFPNTFSHCSSRSGAPRQCLGTVLSQKDNADLDNYNRPEAEDDLSGDDFENRRGSAWQRAPLLTDVEAPSVLVAEDLEFNAEGLLENARPKSGTM